MWTFVGVDNTHDKILNENAIQQHKVVLIIHTERTMSGWEKGREGMGKERLEKVLVNIDYFWKVI